MGLVLNNWKKRSADEQRAIVDWAEQTLKEILT